MINATEVYDITFQSWWCDNGDFWSLPHSNITASQKVFRDWVYCILWSL